MAWELLYTSAPEGVRTATGGWGAVCCTRGIAADLFERLERLSSGVAAGGFAHLKWQDGGGTAWHILTHGAAAGTDYLGRPNRMVHNLALTAAGVRALPGGAAVYFDGESIFRTASWDGPPELTARQATLPKRAETLRPAALWAQITGDAGYAGVIVRAFRTAGNRPFRVRWRSDAEVTAAALTRELVALLSPEERWQFTFSCGVTDGAAAFLQWVNDDDGTTAVELDCTRELPLVAAEFEVELARRGRPDAAAGRAEALRLLPAVNAAVAAADAEALESLLARLEQLSDWGVVGEWDAEAQAQQCAAAAVLRMARLKRAETEARQELLRRFGAALTGVGGSGGGGGGATELWRLHTQLELEKIALPPEWETEWARRVVREKHDDAVATACRRRWRLGMAALALALLLALVAGLTEWVRAARRRSHWETRIAAAVGAGDAAMATELLAELRRDEPQWAARPEFRALALRSAAVARERELRRTALAELFDRIEAALAAKNWSEQPLPELLFTAAQLADDGAAVAQLGAARAEYETRRRAQAARSEAENRIALAELKQERENLYRLDLAVNPVAWRRALRNYEAQLAMLRTRTTLDAASAAAVAVWRSELPELRERAAGAERAATERDALAQTLREAADWTQLQAGGEQFLRRFPNAPDAAWVRRLLRDREWRTTWDFAPDATAERERTRGWGGDEKRNLVLAHARLQTERRAELERLRQAWRELCAELPTARFYMLRVEERDGGGIREFHTPTPTAFSGGGTARRQLRLAETEFEFDPAGVGVMKTAGKPPVAVRLRYPARPENYLPESAARRLAAELTEQWRLAGATADPAELAAAGLTACRAYPAAEGDWGARATALFERTLKVAAARQTRERFYRELLAARPVWCGWIEPAATGDGWRVRGDGGRTPEGEVWARRPEAQGAGMVVIGAVRGGRFVPAGSRQETVPRQTVFMPPREVDSQQLAARWRGPVAAGMVAWPEFWPVDRR